MCRWHSNQSNTKTWLSVSWWFWEVITFRNDNQKQLTKIDNSTANDYKPNKISGTFDDKYIEYKCEGDKQLSVMEYLEHN